MHLFDTDVASEFGIPEAVIFNNIAYWTIVNKANEKHFYEGRYWSFNSVKAWGRIFPYLTSKQIRNALEHLVQTGLVVKGNFNKMAYDRTAWYAIGDEGKKWLHYRKQPICRKQQVDLPVGANGIAPQGEPIPDINTDINTDSDSAAETNAAPTTQEKHQDYVKSFYETYEKTTGLKYIAQGRDWGMFKSIRGVLALDEFRRIVAWWAARWDDVKAGKRLEYNLHNVVTRWSPSALYTNLNLIRQDMNASPRKMDYTNLDPYKGMP